MWHFWPLDTKYQFTQSGDDREHLHAFSNATWWVVSPMPPTPQLMETYPSVREICQGKVKLNFVKESISLPNPYSSIKSKPIFWALPIYTHSHTLTKMTQKEHMTIWQQKLCKAGSILESIYHNPLILPRRRLKSRKTTWFAWIHRC